jgi:exosortase/archaeosortase family protein
VADLHAEAVSPRRVALTGNTVAPDTAGRACHARRPDDLVLDQPMKGAIHLMTVQFTDRGTDAGPGATRRRGTIPETAVAVAVLAASLATCGFNARLRAGEAWLDQLAAHAALGLPTMWKRGTDIFFFDLGTRHPLGLEISLACSTTLLWVPVALAGAALLVSGRARLRHVLPGLALAAGLLILANMVRLVVIVEFTHLWGTAGFDWAHTIVGSLITLTALTATFWLFVRLVSRRRQEGRQPR